MSQAFGKAPSEIYRIRDEVAAWCFDRAVWLFGTTVEHDLGRAAAGAKNSAKAHHAQQQVFAQYGLGEVKFRDPAAAAGVGVKAAQADQSSQVITSDMTGPVSL